MKKKSHYSSLTMEELIGIAARWFMDVLLVLSLATFLIYMLGQHIEMDGNSMQPSIENGETVLLNRFPKAFQRIKRLSVIAYTSENGDRTYLKRVVGLPGETVEIRDELIYINGEPLAVEGLFSSLSSGGLASVPVVLGKNEYFVMGERTDASLDSRFSDLGNLSGKRVLGTVWLRISPFKKIGIIK